MKFYRCCRRLVKIFLAVFYRMRVTGRERLTGDGAIYCCNHTSMTDPIFIGAFIDAKKPVRYMAKDSLFKNRFMRWLVTKLGGYPVRRDTTDLVALKTSLTLLKNGERLIIFPEGGRRDTDDSDAKGGAGLLAVRTGVPVVPVFLSRGRRVFSRVRLVFGEAYHPDPGEGKPNGETFARIGEEIMERIRELGRTI